MLKTTIPFIDLRGKTPVDLLRSYPDKAHAMLRASRRTYGIFSDVLAMGLLPLADRLSHRWLKKSKNPYLHEIEAMADMLRVRGVYALNLCYEWGCTTGLFAGENMVRLLRVLDWPFPSLGKHVVVTCEKGKAGEFFNFTWPGLYGMYQGVAPGRFCAVINQAPMKKRGLGLAGDWFINRLAMGRARGLPPSHALRQVFETAESYAQAKAMLCSIKLASPAIFMLSGLQPGEGCIIERLEDRAEIMELSASPSIYASNHFNSRFSQEGKGYRPREIDSTGRYYQCAGLGVQEVKQADFSWLRPPMLNINTRLVFTADAKSGAFKLQGFEGPAEVTELFTYAGAA